MRNNRSQVQVNKEKLNVNLFCSTPSALNSVIKEFGDFKTNFFTFRGEKVGNSSGFPEEVSEYNTCDGYLSNYVVGAEFVNNYELLYESGIGGDAWSPSYYHALYILSSQKEHIVNLLKEKGYLL